MDNDIEYPFRSGGLVAAEYFWGRADEQRRLRQIYKSGGIAVLSGWRRMGKTSLATLVGSQMVAAGELRWAVLNVRETTAANFAGKLLATAFTLRDGNHAGNLLERAWTFARSLRVQPVVEADPMSGDVKFKLDATLAHRDSNEAQVLHDILASIEAQAAGKETPSALVLDEFQDVLKSAPILPEVLKTRAKSGRGLAVLIVGSSQHLMHDLAGSPSSPLYRIGAQMTIGPIPLDTVTAEIRKRMKWNAVDIAEHAVRQLYDACEGVPLDLQLVAGAALEHARMNGWNEIGEDRMRVILRSVVEQNVDRFVDKWNNLTAIQREVLAALAEHGSKKPLSHEFLRLVSPGNPPLPATVRRSLLAMVEKEVLEANHEEGYRFKDPLLKSYLRLFVTNTGVGG